MTNTQQTKCDHVLARNILATLTYYDVLDFPMTAFEVWRHMIYAPGKDQKGAWTIADVLRSLQHPDVCIYVGMRNGFYMLLGREFLAYQRKERELISIVKIKRMRRYTRAMAWVPFIRMIALTGRLSYKNGEHSSDLDALLVFAHGHIWTGRLLMTLWTHILGIRRYGDKHANRVCLNYHMTDTSLEVPTKDLYAAHEYSFIMPLYGHDVFARFAMSNTWIKSYKPHYITKNMNNSMQCGDNWFLRYVRGCGEVLFGSARLETFVGTRQEVRIKSNPKTRWSGALIRTSNEHLIFLPKPHGPRVFEEYIKRYEALELPWSSLR